MKKSKIIFLSIALIILTIVSIALAFYLRNVKPSDNDVEIDVLAIIDYGSLKTVNKTEEYNVTITKGSSALLAFSLIADLELTNYSFGSYVKGVNGYREELPDYWAFYHYDLQMGEWLYSPYGISNYYLDVNDKIMLQYTG
jgi:hypothetical protein